MEPPPEKRKIEFRYGLTNEFRASRVASAAHSSIPFPITCSREFCMLFHPFVTFSLSPAALSSLCLCDALRRGRRRIDRKKTHNNCFLVVDWAFDIYGSGTRKCAYSWAFANKSPARLMRFFPFLFPAAASRRMNGLVLLLLLSSVGALFI